MPDSSPPRTQPPIPSHAGPATYVVRAHGRLAPTDVERLGGLSVERVDGEGDLIITTLRGLLEDQSALLGALSALHAWQVPVISVSVAGSEGDT